MKKVTNTTKRAQDDPLEFLMDAMIHGSSGSIERQESRGQTEFVSSDTLPANVRPDDKATLEAVGVKFLGPVEGDALFQYVGLPSGWKKEPTDHSMWSKLVDEKGRERAAIFYKAAFYDRDAHLSLCRRFSCHTDYERIDRERMVSANVTDCGTVIYTTSPIAVSGKRDDGYFAALDSADKQAAAWLTEHYPDWKNAAAYWECASPDEEQQITEGQ